MLENIFAFDSFDDGLLRMLQEVFGRHGIPVGRGVQLEGDFTNGASESELASEQFLPEPLRHKSWRTLHGAAREYTVEEWAVVSSELPQVPNKPKDSYGEAAIGAPEDVPLVERTSARSNRFAEEVMGWKMAGATQTPVAISLHTLEFRWNAWTLVISFAWIPNAAKPDVHTRSNDLWGGAPGITGGYGDRVPLWLTALPGGLVAMISLSLEIQVPAQTRPKHRSLKNSVRQKTPASFASKQCHPLPALTPCVPNVVVADLRSGQRCQPRRAAVPRAPDVRRSSHGVGAGSGAVGSVQQAAGDEPAAHQSSTTRPAAYRGTDLCDWLQNGLYVVDHVSGSGQLVRLDIPFFGDQIIPTERAAFMRARVQV